MKTDEPEKEIIEITMDQSESSDSTPSQANTKNPKKKKSRKSKKQKQQPKDNTPAKKVTDKDIGKVRYLTVYDVPVE
ncbi:hypothetical protein RCL_jg25546.t1 [Rhizophagus clarus]|uniref:Uncharacterized protein n=1 Tax=Rhizophagus clarus TaxID=94130 RepID=A0A8H3LMR0_9GLOM|nr:hypothetical protein RCL_jg25546.t1 [Rhizophagus clarus]